MSMLSDNVFDAGLNYIKNNCTRVDLCHTSEPTTYAEATSTYTCANVTVSSTDFTLADGDVSGRKLTFNGKDGSANGTANGTGIFLAYSNGSNELLAVTPCTSQAVTTGANVDFNSYDITELRDPS